MDASPAYTVHAADVERDRDAILGLWRGNLGEEARMAVKYDWFYRRCPYGPPLTLLLRHEESGQWVGVASAGERWMLMDGQAIRAGVLVDLAVLPEHRSLGPAMLLQMALMEAGSTRFDLLYGFPNPKAAPVFKRVGYASLGQLVRHARVLRHGNYLRRRMPGAVASVAGGCLDLVDRVRLALSRTGGMSGRWQSRADDSLDAVWRDSDRGPGPVAIRDGAFLRWRFDASPLVEARYFVIRDRSAAAIAWFACETRGYGLHVLDGWSRGGASGPHAAQVAALLRAARREGHASVSVELSVAAAGDAWRRAGFVAREARPVYGRSAAGDGAALAQRIWLDSADEDE